jgi:aryl-alcohol dehydrogenase-like predicted oxidoreductase
MNTIKFANTDVEVSEMCLGTMMFGDRCDEGESARILDTAFEQGVTFVDTAAAYVGGTTEEILGRIMKGKRDKLFIATKVTKNVDPDWITQSLDESLARMQTDYVDMYMIHWPRENMQIAPMMEALNAAVVAGKTRFIGCCNFPAWLLAHCNLVAQRNGWAHLINNQIPYNLFERGAEVEVLPQAAATNIAITTYRSLALGLLAGKYKPGEPLPEDSRGQTDERVPLWLDRYADALTGFNQFAADRDLHPAQLAVAWVRHSPGVAAPIVGVSSQRQLQASIDAFGVEFSAEEYAELTNLFCATEVQEESGGNFAPLRRSMTLVSS